MDTFLLARVSPDAPDWAHAYPISPVRITPVQRVILDFVRYRQDVWGDTPTRREIAAQAGIVTSAVCRQLDLLARAGVLYKPRGRHRAIWLKRLVAAPGAAGSSDAGEAAALAA